MIYKKSDKVKIKSLKWYNENKNKYNNIRVSPNSGTFVRSMVKFCGTNDVIINVRPADSGDSTIRYSLQNAGWIWNDWMFESLLEYTIYGEEHEI